MRGWALSLGLRPSTSGGTRSPPPPPLLHRRRSGFPTAADICDQLVPMSVSSLPCTEVGKSDVCMSGMQVQQRYADCLIVQPCGDEWGT